MIPLLIHERDFFHISLQWLSFYTAHVKASWLCWTPSSCEYLILVLHVAQYYNLNHCWNRLVLSVSDQ